MSDAPPQLGDLPKESGFNIPTLSSTSDHHEPAAANGSATMADTQGSVNSTKDNVVNNAQSAMNTLANHPVAQNIKETVNNAPVTGAVKDQHAKASAEFNNLANSRKMPESRTVNDQPLTHYHSFFYTLLSWENPRVTGITFAGIVTTIFAFRYVPAVSFALRMLWITLGSVALVETVAKLALGSGIVQSIRPKRYFTIPREALEASLEDVEQLLNFFCIEFQRVLFAENVLHTIAAFVASLTAYYLIKIVPFWGLSLIATSIIFLTPLIYITNQEFIDEHMASANDIVSAQSAQLRDLAGQHASTATSTLKSYAGDYTTKAQGMIGNATGKRSVSSSSTLKAEDFPEAPRDTPAANAAVNAEQPVAA